MKTIDTGKVKLMFVEFSGGDYAFLVDDNGTHFKDNLVIGRLSEITEEQAKDLGFGVKGLHGHEIHFITEEVSNNRGLCSLRSAALLLGIEYKDFNKYLVIKLS